MAAGTKIRIALETLLAGKITDSPVKKDGNTIRNPSGKIQISKIIHSSEAKPIRLAKESERAGIKGPNTTMIVQAHHAAYVKRLQSFRDCNLAATTGT
nr:hypothetical protein Iba_chr10dCG5340 [Ipomoea batatas]